MSKRNILDFVDDALEYGHYCFSKRGRPRLIEKHPPKGSLSSLPTHEEQGSVQIPLVAQEDLMDTSEWSTTESPRQEDREEILELNLSSKEIINVNQSMINLLKLKDRIKVEDA